MPVTLPASILQEIERPWGTNPLIWLLELEVVRASKSGTTAIPAIKLRVCNHRQILTWPVGSPDGEQWHPFNFSHTPIAQSQDGDLPHVDLSVDNSTRTLMRYLHEGEGCEGNDAKLFLVPANGLSIAYPNHEFQLWEFQVSGCTANDEAVTFRLERANFFSRTSPQDRFVAARCRREYGSPECGAIVNEVAAFQVCAKTVDACAAIGEDHRQRGLPVLHPKRFGGFPGLPRGR
jgi:hypothetical protein